MYKLIFNSKYQQINYVSKVDGDLIFIIPFDPANVDFQQYQLWLSEGNVPTPADEPTLP